MFNWLYCITIEEKYEAIFISRFHQELNGKKQHMCAGTIYDAEVTNYTPAPYLLIHDCKGDRILALEQQVFSIPPFFQEAIVIPFVQTRALSIRQVCILSYRMA